MPTQPKGPPWPRHDGSIGDADDDYLVPPDPSLGAVLSAQTNRKRAGWYPPEALEREQRLAASVVGSILGGLAGASLILLIDADDGGLIIVAALLGAVAFGLFGAVIPGRFRHRRSSYACEEGLQQNVIKPSGEVVSSIVRFPDSIGLGRTSSDRLSHGTHGRYVRTLITYIWLDAHRRPLFEIAGQYHKKLRTQTDIRHFADAAQKAWWDHRARGMRSAIRAGGLRVAHGDEHFTLRDGSIEVGSGSRSAQLTREQIASIAVELPTLVIRPTERIDDWLSPEQPFRYSLQGMGDEIAPFLAVVEEKTGFPVFTQIIAPP